MLSVISIVTDFIGATFPIFLLWNVDIKLRSKVALCLLMGLGVVYVPMRDYVGKATANEH